MLAEGVATGAAGARRVPAPRPRERRAARRGAARASPRSPCGGAIPETADYRVVAEPDDTLVGTVNEDLAVESMAGDIFLLGNTLVADPPGRGRRGARRGRRAAQPPTIPFWLGEAPARTRRAVATRSSTLRARGRRAARRRTTPTRSPAWLVDERGVDARRRRADRRLPRGRRAPRSARCRRSDTLVAERFFDETRRHAARPPRAVRRPHQPRLGPRAAQDVLPQLRLRAAGGGDRRRHRALARPAAQLPARRRVPASCRRDTLRDDADPGGARRADVRHPLALERRPARWPCCGRSGGKKRAADSSACEPTTCWPRCSRSSRPARRTCAGDRRDPRPSARAPDDRRLPARGDGPRRPARAARARSSAARSACIARDTTEPSPLAHEILNANPYAFLDDAPLEERRTRAVHAAPRPAVELADELGALDAGGDRRGARARRWPDVRDADELHDVLLSIRRCRSWARRRPGPEPRCRRWRAWFDELCARGPGRGRVLDRAWVAARAAALALRGPSARATWPPRSLRRRAGAR